MLDHLEIALYSTIEAEIFGDKKNIWQLKCQLHLGQKLNLAK